MNAQRRRRAWCQSTQLRSGQPAGTCSERCLRSCGQRNSCRTCQPPAVLQVQVSSPLHCFQPAEEILCACPNRARQALGLALLLLPFCAQTVDWVAGPAGHTAEAALHAALGLGPGDAPVDVAPLAQQLDTVAGQRSAALTQLEQLDAARRSSQQLLADCNAAAHQRSPPGCLEEPAFSAGGHWGPHAQATVGFCSAWSPPYRAAAALHAGERQRCAGSGWAEEQQWLTAAAREAAGSLSAALAGLQLKAQTAAF